MPTWTSNIPSQVKTYANVGAFPATGSVKTIYIAEDTDIAYYWTGSAYQSISIQDLSGLQTIPIVVNSNITAQNDRVYHVVANATFTDPTPVEGRGYVVFVRNGTATIGSIGYAVIGTIVIRSFNSGSWNSLYYYDYLTSNLLFQSRANLSTNVNTDQASNSKYPSVKAVFDWVVSLFVPQSRTINGLDLSTNRNLTTANINDSANRRYVTDAQLTVIGNTSGTNTGDQTFITPRVQTVTSSATVTPTSTNDVVTITAQAEGLTLANPTGTFLEGQSLIIRIKDNGTARTIGYGSGYRAIGVTLPTTTVINKTTYLGCIWNSTDSKLDIIGVCTEV